MNLTKTVLVLMGLAFGSSLAWAQETRLWIVTGSDVASIARQSFAGRSSLKDGRPFFQTFGTGNGVVAVEIAESVLDELVDIIHKNFRRCGGFTVHPSLQAANDEINNVVYAPRFVPPRGLFPTALDQQSIVSPALNEVSGAAIVATIKDLQDLGTRYYQSQRGQDASILIHRLWQSYGVGRADFSVSRFSHSWLQDSVIATIRGTELPEEIIVIGAHLDSINRKNNEDAPGADDDASGIAVVTEVLRVLASMQFRPKRTLQFMAYAAEEVGLRGSGEIADRYKMENKRVIAALQMDMTGHAGSQENLYFVTDFVNAELAEFLKNLMKEYNHSGAHKITFGETKCGYACSDHSSWTRTGVAAAFPFESNFADYNRAIHTPLDTISNLDSTGVHQMRFAKLGIEYMIELGKGTGKKQ